MWLTPVAMPLEKRMRGYTVLDYMVKTEGLVEAILPEEPTPEDVKTFLDMKVSPIWFWHSGQAALCLQQALPNGQVGFAGIAAKTLRDIGWQVDEVTFARELPRVPGTGLAAGGDARAEAQAAVQRALLERRLKGKR